VKKKNNVINMFNDKINIFVVYIYIYIYIYID
jgi:hypothetical protein